MRLFLLAAVCVLLVAVVSGALPTDEELRRLASLPVLPNVDEALDGRDAMFKKSHVLRFRTQRHGREAEPDSAAHDGPEPAPVNEDTSAPQSEDISVPARSPGIPKSDRSRPPVPSLPPDDPCIPLCDWKGGWKTLPCQECILHGLVNGWLYRSPNLPGYNYVMWSRDYCLRYRQYIANQPEGHAVSFAKCFLDQMHLSCNT